MGRSQIYLYFFYTVMGVFDMKCLSMVLGAGVMHRIRTMGIRGRCGDTASLLERNGRSGLIIRRVFIWQM